MNKIGAGFCDRINDAAAGASKLGRVRICLHLKFLNRILTQVVDTATVGSKTGRAERLSPIGIVVVCAVYQQRIHRTLTSEAQPTADVPRNGRRQEYEGRKIAPVYRQPGNALLVDGSVNACACCLKRALAGYDINRFLRRPEFKSDHDIRHRADSNEEILDGCAAKLRLRCYEVIESSW